MEFDPTSSYAPPPRHLLESDSESEDEQVGAQSNRESKRNYAPQIQPWVAISGSSSSDAKQAPLKPRTLLFLDDDAGESILRALSGSPKTSLGKERLFQTLVDRIPQATYVHANSDIVAVSSLSTQVKHVPEAVQLVGGSITNVVQPNDLVIITTYNAVTYISSPDEDEGESNSIDAPIRYLSAGAAPQTSPASLSKLGLAPFDVPNVVTGLAASLTSSALTGPSPVRSVHVILLPAMTPQPHAEYYNPHTAESQLDGDKNRPVAPPLPPHKLSMVKEALQALGSASTWQALEYDAAALLDAVRSGRAVRIHDDSSGSQELKKSTKASAGDGNMYI